MLAKKSSTNFQKNVGRLPNMIGSLPTIMLRLCFDQTGELAGIHQHLFLLYFVKG